MLDVEPLALPGALLLSPRIFTDPRGQFCQLYRQDFAAAAGLPRPFVQDNLSRSAEIGVLRGLHFQSPPQAQAKLVTVLRGAVLDVIVDIRHGSPTFGQSAAVRLDAESLKQLYVPRGFAHGFLVLEQDTHVFYKVDALYSPQHEGGIRWNDPDLGIAWPVEAGEPILSEKDRILPRLRDLPRIFSYDAEGGGA